MRCRKNMTRSVSFFRQKMCRKFEMSEKLDHPDGPQYALSRFEGGEGGFCLVLNDSIVFEPLSSS